MFIKNEERLNINEFLVQLKKLGKENQGRIKEIIKMRAEINEREKILQRINQKQTL